MSFRIKPTHFSLDLNYAPPQETISSVFSSAPAPAPTPAVPTGLSIRPSTMNIGDCDRK